MRPIDPSLLAIFEAEQREHVERLRALLTAAGAGERAGPAMEEALRRAHTLKGAARAVGIQTIELLAHRLEALFARVRDNSVALDSALSDTVQRALDGAEDVLASVVGRRPEPDLSGILSSLERALGGAAPAAAAPLPDARPPREPATPAEPSGEPPPDFVRVSARRIDGLIRTSSQLLAASAAGRRAFRNSAEIFETVQQVEREWSRLRREAGTAWRGRHDPGSPFMESLNRFDLQMRSLLRQARRAALAQQQNAWAFDRLASEVYEGTCAVRMTPAESVFGAFRRMVRDLAAEDGKEVEFHAEGLEVQADRLVLQALKDPVMHLLRNSISHGIERPDERASVGKPRAGTIRLRFESQGGRLHVSVRDDGRGLDLEQVARVAVSRGLLTDASAGAATRKELASLILKPGFSTAPSVTPLSGRGVGLAVVQDQVARLQGEIAVEPLGAAGLSITLSVPLSISTHHLVLVGCGGHTFALPARNVERLCRVRMEEIEAADGGEAVRIGGQAVPLARLADLLEIPVPRADASSEAAGDNGRAALPAAVLLAGERRLGVIVDAFLDERETVVKELGLAPSAMGLATGGVPLEDGTVAVLLNVSAVFERFRSKRGAPGLKAAETPARKRSRVLVVDDSITTRSLERSILEAHGYEVRVAVDGVEALAKLRAERSDLVIADVRMPRMDGFELLEHMKRDPELARIPVIVVTSLESREDQERGLSLGADAYIVKRKFDQRELLNTVRQIL